MSQLRSNVGNQINGLKDQSILEIDDDSLASTPRRPTIYKAKSEETFDDDHTDNKEVNVSVLNQQINDTEIADDSKR